MKVKARLNTRDITDTINKVNWYENYLRWKVEQFLSELAEVGIEVIQDNVKVEYDGEVRNFGDNVFFAKPITWDGDEAVICTLIAEGEPYLKEWMGGAALVNPLLMAEFGSGEYAEDGRRGTFPSPTAKRHAENPPWFWRDTRGLYHSGGKPYKSRGNEPTRPMLKAKEEMIAQIQEVAQRVFST